MGRPEGDSLLHPSSYCTRGNQGTSAQCSLLTSPGIFHNSGNCHQESQFLTYMTCLLALSIELETHNYSIWGKRFKISIFFRINKRQWKNRLWTLTVESKTDVCLHYRAVEQYTVCIETPVPQWPGYSITTPGYYWQFTLHCHHHQSCQREFTKFHFAQRTHFCLLGHNHSLKHRLVLSQIRI